MSDQVDFSGNWISRYTYFSSSRNAQLVGEHLVAVTEQDDHLIVRSVPEPAALTMTLDVDGKILTGAWIEDTDRDGHYAGQRFHGALQLEFDGDARLVGKWVGFSRSGGINTGDWLLIRRTV